MALAIRTLCYAFVYALCVLAPATAGNGVDSPYLQQIVGGGYVKVFGDEFPLDCNDCGNPPRYMVGLDTDKWWTRYIYSNGTLDYLNDETQRFRESGNHVIDGSTSSADGHTLHLKAKYLADGSLTSGMIRSKRRFLGGYFEARIRKPAGRGQRPSFWLNSGTRTSDGALRWPPEIDIMDDALNAPSDTECCEHANMTHSDGKVYNWTTRPQNNSVIIADPDFNTTYNYMWVTNPDRTMKRLDNEFHVWSLFWKITNYQTQSGVISTYLDGQLLVRRNYNWVYDDGTPAGPAHVILDLAMGDSWGGTIDKSLVPEALEVDYIRVYQDWYHRNQEADVDTVGVNLCPTDGSQC